VFSTSPLLSKTYAYDHGFRDFFDLIPAEKDPFLRRIKGGHHLLRKGLTHQISQALGLRTRPAKIYVSASELTERVCQWIEAASNPFFVWAHYMDVHWPYHLEETLTQPQEIARAWEDVVHLHNANWNGASISPEQRDRYIHLYETALAYTDAQIGRLVDHLEKTGRKENTVILLLADHGEEFLDHGRWGHWEDNLYDEILNIPFVISLPGQPARRVVNQQVRTLDIMPTILDLCGCPALRGMQGTSLAPLWQDPPAAAHPEVSISEMWRDEWHIIAVRKDGFKYIWDNRKPGQAQLYDLRADPGETQNVSGEYPEVAREMHHHVEEVLREMELTRPEHRVAEPDLDEEMRTRLRDLGYIQ
jgi:arylsulfatase A-like enzyme